MICDYGGEGKGRWFQMGYRNELFRRLKTDGIWEALSTEDGAKLESMTDDQARDILVKMDEVEMNDPEIVGRLAMMETFELISAFRGMLFSVHSDRAGKLTDAGIHLADFFESLEASGIAPAEIVNELSKLNLTMVAALKVLRRGPKRE